MSRQKADTSLVSIIVLGLSLVIIFSLAKSALEFRSARDRLVSVQREVAKLEAEREQLTQEVKLVQDPAAIDLSIRNKLNVAKPDETVIIMSQEGDSSLPSLEVSVVSHKKPPYLQWWDLLTARE